MLSDSAAINSRDIIRSEVCRLVVRLLTYVCIQDLSMCGGCSYVCRRLLTATPLLNFTRYIMSKKTFRTGDKLLVSIFSSRDQGRRRAPSIMGADLKTDLGVCDWCLRRQRSPEEEHTNGSFLERYELSPGSMAACPVQGGFFIAIKSSLSCCTLSRSHT